MFQLLANKKLAALILFYLLNAVFSSGAFPIILTLPPFFIVAYNVSRIHNKYLTPEDVLWFVIYLFFVIHPCQSIHENGTAFDVYGPTALVRYLNTEMIEGMAIVCVFLTAFTVTLRSLPATYVVNNINFGSGDGGPPFAVLLLIMIASVLVIVPLSGGLANFVSPRAMRDADVATSPVTLIPTAMVSVCAWLVVAKYKASSATKLITTPPLLAALLILLFVFNPFNTSRFFLLGSWLPVFFVVLNGKVKTTTFYVAAIIGISIAFPILNITTRTGLGGFNAYSTDLETAGILHLPFMDGFEILVQAVRYMGNHDFAFGAKTVAIALFFVPRAWWADKPIVGGLDVGRELLYNKLAGTDNLSFFLAGDFYLDLGMLGVLAGGIATAYVFHSYGNKRPTFFYRQNMYSYAWISSLPILIRGPLGAVMGLFFFQYISLFAFQLLWGTTSYDVSRLSVRKEMLRWQ